MDPSSVADWAQYGAGGLVVVAFIFGWLVPGRIYDRAMERAERLEAENRELRASVEERVLPLVFKLIEREQSREGR